MKGIPTTPEVKAKIVELAKIGYSQKEIAGRLNISERTASRYGAGYFTKCEKKLSGGNTYAIPKDVWADWDRATRRLRKYFKRSNS